MKVAFVSPAWQRFTVTRLALAQRRLLCDELARRGHVATGVVVADDDNLDIAREFGFDTVAQTNDQLGRKFNDGIEHACRAHGAEFVVVLGSDAWMHPDLFDDWPIAADQPDVLTGHEIAVVDVAAGKLRCCRVRGRYGVTPWVFSRAALEPSGFRPVNDEVNRGVDGSLIAGLRVWPNWTYRDPHPFCRVDFKTDMNLTPYRWMADGVGYGDPVDAWSTLAGWYPAELAAVLPAGGAE